MKIIRSAARSGTVVEVSASGMLVQTSPGLDAGSLVAATEPIDLLAFADEFGLFHAASLQVANEATALTTVVMTLQISNDGKAWANRTGGATAGGAGIVADIDVTGVRFVRAIVTTAEASETCKAIICLTRDAE